MPRSRWFLVAAITAAICALWAWLWFGSTGGRAAERSRGAVAEPSQASGQDPSPALRPDRSQPDPSSGAARESAPLDAQRAPDASSTPLAERLVEIVAAESGRPLAGAEVWYRQAKAAFEPSAFDALVARADTHATRADELGLARIPWRAEESVLVLARCPGRPALMGGEIVAAPRDPLQRTRLELYRDWDLVVEVLAAQGAPAPGLTIAVQDGTGTVYDETDASGRVTFAHLGAELALTGAERTEARVLLALEEPLVQSFELESPPSGPVRFRLPPLAALSLLVLDPEHRPVADGTSLQLGFVREGEERQPSAFALQEREYVEQETQAGRARFAEVSLGGELELVVTEERSGQAEKHYFQGPTRDGEQLEQTIVLERAWPILSLRAVDEAGAAIAGARLALELHQRSGYDLDDRRHETTTDAAGRFELDLPAHFAEGDQRWLALTLAGGSRGARLDLGRALPPGRVDLGDVCLTELPLLASGRVVDGGGTGLAGAGIEAQFPITNRADGGGGVWFWKDLGQPLTSAADGSFELRAIAPAERLRLTAVLADQRSAPGEVEVGWRGVELVVQAPGSVAGAVRCDPEVPVELVSISLARASSPDPQDPSATADTRERATECSVALDGTFRSPDLLPGVYTLCAGVKNGACLVSVEGIQVRASECCADPRLAAIDLRGVVHPLRLVLRAAGDPAALQGHVLYRPADSQEEKETAFWFRGSPVRLLTPYPSIDGRLVVRGFRPVAFRGWSGERVVELVPALPVELLLPAAVDLPEPPRYLKAVLAPENDSWLLDYGAPVFDAARKIACRAPLPGKLRVHWILEQRGATSGSAATLAVEPVQWVEVQDVEGPQCFELEVTNAALAAAIAALREE